MCLLKVGDTAHPPASRSTAHAVVPAQSAQGKTRNANAAAAATSTTKAEHEVPICRAGLYRCTCLIDEAYSNYIHVQYMLLGLLGLLFVRLALNEMP